MNILFAASEIFPFSKTGGLADVAGAFSKVLASFGNNVTVITPAYKSVLDAHLPLKAEGVIEVPISNNVEAASLLLFEEDSVRYVFIRNDKYFNREYLYSTPSGDYEDNAERFIFFSRAILEAAKALNVNAEIIHTNDWQCGLTNTYLKTLYKDVPAFAKTKSVFTIHNIAYHGLFWHWDMHLTGLGWEEFIPEKLEFHGKINLLKAGIVYSDFITTVSETYAKEIQTPEYGYGLEGAIEARADVLKGIVNGADYNVWNPETDNLIPANYSVDSPDGKKICKEALQKRLGLEVRQKAPLMAMISRLTEQKGIDLLAAAAEDILSEGVQLVLLAFGESKYNTLFENLQKKYKKNLAVIIEFDEELAHIIEAGADIYLMPSKYEPCGLNQLYSMRYGTVPIVRNTGGLADTINDYAQHGVKSGTGFKFNEYSPDALLSSMRRATDMFLNDKESWRKLMVNGMKADWSWQRAAKEYIDIYRKVKKS